MANDHPLLEVRGLRKRFPGVLALDGVGLSIRAGEVLAVVGENGAGKSTLMKILAGVYTPDDGQILPDARILIMDEPTSSLTQRETDRLFAVIADLKKAGVAVLYISHRLAEVNAVADRVTVLRDGRNAGDLSREQVSHAAIVRLMVGRDLRQFYARQHAPPPNPPPAGGGGQGGGPARLEVRGLRYQGGP